MHESDSVEMAEWDMLYAHILLEKYGVLNIYFFCFLLTVISSGHPIFFGF